MTYKKRYRVPKYGDNAGASAIVDTGDPYQNLANAIVQQAADDYRSAKRYLAKHPEIPEDKKAIYNWVNANKTVVECEAFFRGDWIKMLTNLDGREILAKLKEELNGSKAVSPDG